MAKLSLLLEIRGEMPAYEDLERLQEVILNQIYNVANNGAPEAKNVHATTIQERRES
jgi:hypothetical protein